MKTVLVGLSGGVDSAAVAKLLLEEGYRVHGAYLALCGDSDPSGAKEVAKKLGIGFSVVRRQRAFENRVIRPFTQTYKNGKTPNPCVECNRKMKIKALLEEADRLGIRMVATGHYARIEEKDGRYQLKAALDENKDQSYFLWKLTQNQLSRLIFPLAHMEKGQVRALAADLVAREEKESMEICFVPENDPRAFLASRLGQVPEGDFVDGEGRVLGRHKGICFYTVGQRRGLGIALGERRFVKAIRPETGQVVLGTEEELLTDTVTVENLHFASCLKRNLPSRGISVKGRHRAKAVPCELSFSGREVKVKLFSPVKRFAPGQSACFYAGDTLLFGGEIKE